MSRMAEETTPRLQGANIVHFAHGMWNEIWRTNQHIFWRLAKENTVLYVEPRVFWLVDVRQGRVKREDWRAPRLKHEANGLWLYRHPVWAPRTPRPGLEALMRRLRWSALRQAMAKIGLRDPLITWTYQPKDAELVGTLNERLIVFQVIDEYAAFRHQSPEQQRFIKEAEQKYLPKADLILVTSQALLETRRALNPNITLVPNGVDFAVFERAYQAHLPPPDDIAALRRPIIGYSGHISLRLNLTMLADMTRQRPEWSFALVGSVWETGCEAELAVLRSLPNVHFLGQKPAEQVPYYMLAFDVGLIPYHPGEESRNISPIKLYEYLAAGLPVVSIDMPSLDGFRHIVRIGDSADSFLAHVEAALQEKTPAQVEERRRLAAANTWDQRVEQISGLVRAQLDAKLNGHKLRN